MPTKARFLENRRGFLTKSLRLGSLIGSGMLPVWKSALADLSEVDVVVVGSGAAGMTAALAASKRGLRVLVIEKAKTFGGSTARSGGGIWIRNNQVNQAAGIVDSIDEADGYLAQVALNDSPRANQRAFIEQGPQMIDFIVENTPLRFRRMEDYSDYYPELAGGKAEGSSIEPELFDARLLGTQLTKLAAPYIPTPKGVVIYGADYKWLCLARVTLQGAKTAAEAVQRYVSAIFSGKKPLTMGQALAAGLRVGLMQVGVPLRLNTSLLAITTSEDGRVDGILVESFGVKSRIKAREAVVIAAGGFEHNLEMRRTYQKQPIGTEWTLGAAENTGDGIRAGQDIGADVALMDDAWWGPTILLEPGKPYFCLSERSLPGSILVNADAERFVNESSPYHDVVNAMYKQKLVGDQIPIWLVTDQTYRDRYLFKDHLPLLPLPEAWFKSGAVVSAPTLEALAAKMSVPAAALLQTITTFNGYAEVGVDPDFNRGKSAYDRYYADPSRKPNPSLASLERGPFYAFRMQAGDLGTKGGLCTDEKARVLRADGQVIDGLYAAGNSSQSVMGRSYAANGSTLGPAMTFGYIAGQDIADRAGK